MFSKAVDENFVPLRRTMRIREGDPSPTTLEPWERFCGGMLALERRMGWEDT